MEKRKLDNPRLNRQLTLISDYVIGVSCAINWRSKSWP